MRLRAGELLCSFDFCIAFFCESTCNLNCVSGHEGAGGSVCW